MNKSNVLDKKIVALQMAVESLRNNRNELLKELETVKSRTAQKQTV